MFYTANVAIMCIPSIQLKTSTCQYVRCEYVFDYNRNVLQFDNDLQAFKNVIPNSLCEAI